MDKYPNAIQPLGKVIKPGIDTFCACGSTMSFKWSKLKRTCDNFRCKANTVWKNKGKA